MFYHARESRPTKTTGTVRLALARRDEPKVARSRFLARGCIARGRFGSHRDVYRAGKMRRHYLDQAAVIGGKAVGGGGVEREHGDQTLADHERDAEASGKGQTDRVHARVEIERGVRIDDRLAIRGNPSGQPLADSDAGAAKHVRRRPERVHDHHPVVRHVGQIPRAGCAGDDVGSRLEPSASTSATPPSPDATRARLTNASRPLGAAPAAGESDTLSGAVPGSRRDCAIRCMTSRCTGKSVSSTPMSR